MSTRLSHRALRGVGLSAALIVLAFLVPHLLVGQDLNVMDLFLIAVPGAVALNVVMGVAGQATVGSTAFMAIGALSAAVLDLRWHWPFIAVIIVSAVVSALAGLVATLPAIRLSGIYLVMSTLALFYLVLYVAQEYEKRNIAGGFGAFTFETPSLFGWTIQDDGDWFLVLYVFAILVIWLARRAVHGKYGRGWLTIREKEIVARSLGVNVNRMKFSAAALSSGIIGIQGALYAYFLRALDFANTFTLDLAIAYIAMIVIGGWGSVWGAVIGAAFVTWVPYVVQNWGVQLPSWVPGSGVLRSNLAQVEALIYGVAIIFFVLLAPDGLVSLFSRAGRAALRTARRLAAKGPAGAVLERWSRTAADAPISQPGGDAAVTAAELDDQIEYEDHSTSGPVLASGSAGAMSLSDESESPLLDVRDLKVVYNGLAVAVVDVSMTVTRGSVVAVLGPNGAGKTSTVRAITGFLRTEHVKVGGQVLYKGRDITGRAPDVTARAGVVLVPERDKIFTSLTVEENLVAMVRTNKRETQRMLQETYAMFPALARRRSMRAGFLSGGERQMLALARGLALRAQLLVIDEMSLGVSPRVVSELVETVKRIVTEYGSSVLLVEQNSAVALDVADYVYLLDRGRSSLSGTADSLRDEDTVRKSYLGV